VETQAPLCTVAPKLPTDAPGILVVSQCDRTHERLGSNPNHCLQDSEAKPFAAQKQHSHRYAALALAADTRSLESFIMNSSLAGKVGLAAIARSSGTRP
jgi:hypothetical protein